MNDRRFKVVNKETGVVTEIVGVEALAKHVNVPVNEIPKIRLWKYSVTSTACIYESKQGV